MIKLARKNINDLTNDFLKNPKIFESYVKGKINSLEIINYLKSIHFNTNIDDYTFFKHLFDVNGIDFNLILFYEEYRNNVINNLPKENIIKVKTNIFYIDAVKEYFRNYQEKGNINNIPKYFSRMYCNLLLLTDDLNKSLPRISNIYTIDELIELCQNKEAFLVDNYVESENITFDEIKEGIITNEIMLSEANLNSLNFDNKILADFTTCKNEFDRRIWYILYGNLFHYIRTNKITFDSSLGSDNFINLDIDFYNTISHIINIFNNIKLRYKKKKKDIPFNIQKIIDESNDKIEIVKGKYTNYKDELKIECKVYTRK